MKLSATLLGNRDMRLFLAAQGLDSLAIGVRAWLPWLLLMRVLRRLLAWSPGDDRAA